jgi:hypothetical protein
MSSTIYFEYEYKGKKTVARAFTSDGLTSKGVAKCNPEDKYSRAIGEGIATSRALANIAKVSETVWVSRVKSLF